MPPFCAELVRLTDSTRDGTATPSLVTGGGCNKREGEVACGRILKIDRPYCKVMLCQSFSTIHLKLQIVSPSCPIPAKVFGTCVCMGLFPNRLSLPSVLHKPSCGFLAAEYVPCPRLFFVNVNRLKMAQKTKIK